MPSPIGILTPPSPAPVAATGRHFVGLALLRSLLQHEDIATDDRRSDGVLDLISLLSQEAPAAEVVAQFCRVRRDSEGACYLAMYRLRRWLEDNIQVSVGGQIEPLNLTFRDFNRLVQSLQRHAWENDLDWENMDDVPVFFEWAEVAETVAVA